MKPDNTKNTMECFFKKQKRTRQYLNDLNQSLSIPRSTWTSIFFQLDSIIPYIPYGEEGLLISNLFYQVECNESRNNNDEFHSTTNPLQKDSKTKNSKITSILTIISLLHTRCQLWSVKLRLLMLILLHQKKISTQNDYDKSWNDEFHSTLWDFMNHVATNMTALKSLSEPSNREQCQHLYLSKIDMLFKHWKRNVRYQIIRDFQIITHSFDGKPYSSSFHSNQNSYSKTCNWKLIFWNLVKSVDDTVKNIQDLSSRTKDLKDDRKDLSFTKKSLKSNPEPCTILKLCRHYNAHKLDKSPKQNKSSVHLINLFLNENWLHDVPFQFNESNIDPIYLFQNIIPCTFLSLHSKQLRTRLEQVVLPLHANNFNNVTSYTLFQNFISNLMDLIIQYYTSKSNHFNDTTFMNLRCTPVPINRFYSYLSFILDCIYHVSPIGQDVIQKKHIQQENKQKSHQHSPKYNYYQTDLFLQVLFGLVLHAKDMQSPIFKQIEKEVKFWIITNLKYEILSVNQYEVDTFINHHLNYKLEQFVQCTTKASDSHDQKLQFLLDVSDLGIVENQLELANEDVHEIIPKYFTKFRSKVANAIQRSNSHTIITHGNNSSNGEKKVQSASTNIFDINPIVGKGLNQPILIMDAMKIALHFSQGGKSADILKSRVKDIIRLSEQFDKKDLSNCKINYTNSINDNKIEKIPSSQISIVDNSTHQLEYLLNILHILLSHDTIWQIMKACKYSIEFKSCSRYQHQLSYLRGRALLVSYIIHCRVHCWKALKDILTSPPALDDLFATSSNIFLFPHYQNFQLTPFLYNNNIIMGKDQKIIETQSSNLGIFLRHFFKDFIGEHDFQINLHSIMIPDLNLYSLRLFEIFLSNRYDTSLSDKDFSRVFTKFLLWLPFEEIVIHYQALLGFILRKVFVKIVKTKNNFPFNTFSWRKDVMEWCEMITDDINSNDVDQFNELLSHASKFILVLHKHNITQDNNRNIWSEIFSHTFCKQVLLTFSIHIPFEPSPPFFVLTSVLYEICQLVVGEGSVKYSLSECDHLAWIICVLTETYPYKYAASYEEINNYSKAIRMRQENLMNIFHDNWVKHKEIGESIINMAILSTKTEGQIHIYSERNRSLILDHRRASIYLPCYTSFTACLLQFTQHNAVFSSPALFERSGAWSSWCRYTADVIFNRYLEIEFHNNEIYLMMAWTEQLIAFVDNEHQNAIKLGLGSYITFNPLLQYLHRLVSSRIDHSRLTKQNSEFCFFEVLATTMYNCKNIAKTVLKNASEEIIANTPVDLIFNENMFSTTYDGESFKILKYFFNSEIVLESFKIGSSIVTGWCIAKCNFYMQKSQASISSKIHSSVETMIKKLLKKLWDTLNQRNEKSIQWIYFEESVSRELHSYAAVNGIQWWSDTLSQLDTLFKMSNDSFHCSALTTKDQEYEGNSEKKNDNDVSNKNVKKEADNLAVHFKRKRETPSHSSDIIKSWVSNSRVKEEIIDDQIKLHKRIRKSMNKPIQNQIFFEADDRIISDHNMAVKSNMENLETSQLNHIETSKKDDYDDNFDDGDESLIFLRV